MAGHDGEMLVNYQSLDAAASDVREAAKGLSDDLQWIHSALKNVSDIWDGEAKGAFVAAQQKWAKDTQEIQEALRGVAQAVSDGRDRYHAGDKRGASFFE
ncbi:WXG100 family type VII secretion target [Streptomyces purpurogeneiscleroticus]|uniref:WXG100 family type VII secretion target n=1 Tax=Streptomyces purpurogeneiscleroticus TaxID=68259 RepID=UPI001CBEC2B0|nr:WXG100 family type VII secretion target [Streptomyces purpurogeneiscleroticus]MBZ4014786.1 hypothetical protein [Streptomyces purpurogeneiscleroticus]